MEGMGEETLSFPLLKSGKRQKVHLGRRVSTHFVAYCGHWLSDRGIFYSPSRDHASSSLPNTIVNNISMTINLANNLGKKKPITVESVSLRSKDSQSDPKKAKGRLNRDDWDVSATCAVVIFRVKLSCITSVDGITGY